MTNQTLEQIDPLAGVLDLFHRTLDSTADWNIGIEFVCFDLVVVFRDGNTEGHCKVLLRKNF